MINGLINKKERELMSRKIVHKKAAAGLKPAVRVSFGGKTLNDYFSLRKIAVEDYGMTQTTLARIIITDFLKAYREKKLSKPGIKGFQLSLLSNPKPKKEAKNV